MHSQFLLNLLHTKCTNYVSKYVTIVEKEHENMNIVVHAYM